MDTDNLIEKQNVSAEAEGTDRGRSVEPVKLVEMGPVSVETKGFHSGLEMGFYPRY
jgi:hypothetical protein